MLLIIPLFEILRRRGRKISLIIPLYESNPFGRRLTTKTPTLNQQNLVKVSEEPAISNGIVQR